MSPQYVLQPPGQAELERASSRPDTADAVFQDEWAKALQLAKRDRERRAQSERRRHAAK